LGKRIEREEEQDLDCDLGEEEIGLDEEMGEDDDSYASEDDR
jgi:hypothetical protein